MFAVKLNINIKHLGRFESRSLGCNAV